MMRPTRLVPCNSCTACCQGDGIFLHPEHGDDPTLYETEEMGNPVTGEVAVKLKQKANGDCAYLDRGTGCTIWHKRPVICREFDCRVFATVLLAETTRTQRRRLVRQNIISKDVLAAGRRLTRDG